MTEKDLIVKEKVENTGLFDFAGFYSYAYGWFKYEEYVVIEEEYTEKVSGNEREAVIKWKAWKTVTDYFKIEIAVKYEVRNMTEVEVEVDGRKKNLTNARLILKINGTVETDWQGKFASGTPFTKKLGALYNKMVAGKEIVAYWDPLYYRIWNLHAVIKKYFDMQAKKNAYKGYIGEN